jgi:hypothetical protein
VPDPEWPQPPIWWEDLPNVLTLLGHDADNRFRGWVLVPASWMPVGREGPPVSVTGRW